MGFGEFMLAHTSIEHIHEVSAALRQIFATLFPVAESPFVANTLLEILSESIEKCLESGAEGKSSCLRRLETDAKHMIRENLDDPVLHV
jgi:hypothetical protein